MNRFDRLNAIVLLLQTRRSVTAAWLAAHFEVSERTIYRDMRSLSTSGVQVEGEAGVGYYLPRDYKLPPVMFSETEASSLVLAAKIAQNLLDDTLKKSLDQAELKIRAVLPPEINRHIEALLTSISVHMGDTRGSVVWIARLQKAVARRTVVNITYETGGKSSIRMVEPVGLIFYSGQWHFIGWCRLREDYRDFRVDRIIHFEETSEVVFGNPRTGLDEYLDDLRNQQHLEEVTVIFTELGWNRWESLPEQHGLVKQETLENGGKRCVFVVWEKEGFCRWLLTFAGEVQVEAPPEYEERFTLLIGKFKS